MNGDHNVVLSLLNVPFCNDLPHFGRDVYCWTYEKYRFPASDPPFWNSQPVMIPAFNENAFKGTSNLIH